MLSATQSVERESSDRGGASDLHLDQVSVMVVDDHAAVRMGLTRLLDDERDFNVEAVCADAESAVARAQTEAIDVAVIDYHLGGHNGLWVCRRLKQLARAPRAIIYSAFANDHLAACCVVAGADGVLNKGGLGSELCDAVRSVSHGRRLLPKVAQPIADMLSRRLEDREQAIFGMLMAGVPRTEVCQTLGISRRELSVREEEMLRRLEVLPGEAAAASLRHNRLDMDRLISR